jgi:hypothetical protein
MMTWCSEKGTTARGVAGRNGGRRSSRGCERCGRRACVGADVCAAWGLGMFVDEAVVGGQ